MASSTCARFKLMRRRATLVVREEVVGRREMALGVGAAEVAVGEPADDSVGLDVAVLVHRGPIALLLVLADLDPRGVGIGLVVELVAAVAGDVGRRPEQKAGSGGPWISAAKRTGQQAYAI